MILDFISAYILSPYTTLFDSILCYLGVSGNTKGERGCIPPAFLHSRPTMNDITMSRYVNKSSSDWESSLCHVYTEFIPYSCFRLRDV